MLDYIKEILLQVCRKTFKHKGTWVSIKETEKDILC